MLLYIFYFFYKPSQILLKWTKTYENCCIIFIKCTDPKKILKISFCQFYGQYWQIIKNEHDGLLLEYWGVPKTHQNQNFRISSTDIDLTFWKVSFECLLYIKKYCQFNLCIFCVIFYYCVLIALYFLMPPKTIQTHK